MAGRRYRLQQGRTNEGLHALLWPVSRLLVRYIEANTADFRGARVLELGAGVVRARAQSLRRRKRVGSVSPHARASAQGLAGIGAAAYGAHVLLTDKVRRRGAATRRGRADPQRRSPKQCNSSRA